MKRGSLIAPLLLILIGTLFLIKNIRPDLRVFEMLVNFWPIILIAWGLLRLVEVFSYRMRSEPMPRTGVTGGEWFLIILLTVIGGGVWSANRAFNNNLGRIRIGGVEVFGESFDYSLEASKASVGKTPRIVIENIRGATRIVGTDADEVKVTGRKVIRALDKAAADKVHERTPLEITSAADVVTVRTNIERAEGEPRASSDIEITVPRGASVETRGRSGDVDVSHIDGEVVINSERGGVRLQNLARNARVDVRRSDIVRALDLKGDLEIKGGGRDLELENIAGQVTIDGSYSGDTTIRRLQKALVFQSSVTDLRAMSIPGELQLSLGQLSANNVIGPFRLTTKSKDVQLTNITDSIELRVERGDVELRQSRLPVPKLDIEVESGDIELAVPQNAKLNLDVVTRRGEIDNEYDASLKIAETGNGAELKNAAASGSQARLKTGRGRVVLRRVVAGETDAPVITPEAPPAEAPKAPPAPPKAPLPRSSN